MAGKKGTIGNREFLNKVTQNTQGAAKSVSKTLNMVGTGVLQADDGKKRIEYINISQMEGAPTEWNRHIVKSM